MQFKDTVASQCRYSGVTERIFEGYDILWDNSEAGYQGEVELLGKKGRAYQYFGFAYGSCSGCDPWGDHENDSPVVEMEFRKKQLMSFKNEKELLTWYGMLEETKGNQKLRTYIYNNIITKKEES